MNVPPRPPSSRIEVVDALRGFAVFSIMLLHNLEHFDFYYFPNSLPSWMKISDPIVWKVLFFLFSGKSYAIFALLFGFTFFIQSNNQAKKGLRFRGRFAWRLLLLLLFGLFNSVFYQGDILTMYAVIGFVLIPVEKLSTRTVLVIAIILMLQPLEWIRFLTICLSPNVSPLEPASNFYFGQTAAYLPEHSFWATALGNLTTGKIAVLYWSWENGRFFQTASLFMLGMLIGRNGLFHTGEKNKAFWKITFVRSCVSFLLFYSIRENLFHWEMPAPVWNQFAMIISTWSNFAFMLVIVSGFYLLYQKILPGWFKGSFAPFGRMSLSNYILQSVAGSFIYYGYGLGLYRMTGATICLMIGVMLFLMQLWFCRWWLNRHLQGPFENLWHRATWI